MVMPIKKIDIMKNMHVFEFFKKGKVYVEADTPVEAILKLKELGYVDIGPDNDVEVKKEDVSFKKTRCDNCQDVKRVDAVHFEKTGMLKLCNECKKKWFKVSDLSDGFYL